MAEQKSRATSKLGEALHGARGQASQQDVADAALINVRNYGAYERGESEMGIHMLFRLAKVLGTTPAALLDGIEDADVPDIDDLTTAWQARAAREARQRRRHGRA